jgi:hypothetical protein
VWSYLQELREDLPENEMGVQLLNCNAALREFIYNTKGPGRLYAFLLLSNTRVYNL